MSDPTADPAAPPPPGSDGGPPRQGLWRVMGIRQEGASDAETQLNDRADSQSDPHETADPPESVLPPQAPPARRRSLWEMMSDDDAADERPAGVRSDDSASVATLESPVDDRPDAPSVAADSDFDSHASRLDSPLRGRGLWGLMKGADAPVEMPEQRLEPPSVAAKPQAPAIEPPSTEAFLERIPEPPVPSPRSALDPGPAPPPPPLDNDGPHGNRPAAPSAIADLSTSFTPATAGRHPLAPDLGAAARPVRGSVPCAVAGGVSILLSALAVLPHFWARLPATIVGFAAIALGMTAWTGIGRSKARRPGQGLILAGSIGGAVGMFLGPLLFSPLGSRQRESSGQAWTEQHLSQIGTALDRFSAEKKHFPPGGVFETAADGTDRPMHGWMTALLPYLGHEKLAQSIHRDLPFDDPANRDAMSTVVETFLAAGGSRDPVAGGRAPAHFSGVGGEVVIPGQGLAHLGIFARNAPVRHDQVLDGLSQTLVAGEIVHLYPAWGEPENWREVGKGLNVQSRGFGNADGTGALFLKADGSVQFFSNQTSPDVLLRLSTRDGGEGGSDVP